MIKLVLNVLMLATAASSVDCTASPGVKSLGVDPDGTEWFVKSDGITKRGDYVYGWVIFNLTAAKSDPMYRPFQSLLMNVGFDCVRRLNTVLLIKTFDGPMSTGILGVEASRPPGWNADALGKH